MFVHLHSASLARLELVSEALEPMQEAGVIREAVLTTAIDPQGAALYRLRLLAHCGKAPSLDLVIPEGMSLVRVRRDGTEVARFESGNERHRYPLPAASQAPRFHDRVEYVATGETDFESAADASRASRRFRFPVSRSRGSSLLPAVTRRSIAGPGFSPPSIVEVRRAGRDGRP